MGWDFYTPRGDVSYGTALPTSPFDGQQHVLVDNASAPTYSWLLQYVSAKASNKWIFLGGTPARAAVETNQGTSSTSYVDLATTGPSFTVPVAGDYWIRWGSNVNATAADDINSTGYHSVALGGTAAADADSCFVTARVIEGGTNLQSVHASVTVVKTKSLAASAAIVSKYRATANTWNFQQRWLEVTPIAIGG